MGLYLIGCTGWVVPFEEDLHCSNLIAKLLRLYSPGHLFLLAVLFLSTIILTFPAIDVVSAFPLTAITLGENLLGVIGKSLSLDRSNRGVVLVFRLLASVLPIIVRLNFKYQFERKIWWLGGYDFCRFSA